MFNVLAFYSYFHFQNFIGLYAARLYTVRIVGIVLAINTVLNVFVTPVIARQIVERSYRTICILSFCLLALGMFTISRGDLVYLLAGTALFTVGEIGLLFKGDLEILSYFPEDSAVAFGFQRLSAGVGALLSGSIGGVVFEHYNDINDPSSFWNVMALQCLVVAGLAMTVSRRKAFQPVCSEIGK